MPRIRTQPEDFFVEEIPLYRPEGNGTYTLVLLEKRNENTATVARRLAAAAGVAAKRVGYAGRKDRRGVTRQWLSVPGLAPERALAFELSGVRVLQAHRHPHGLARGDLLANRFEVTIREVGREEAAAARRHLDELVENGLPNRFGGQRFGRDGANAERGRQILAGEPIGVPRADARLFVSALQAEVFDTVLRSRPFDELLPGDLAWRHSTGSVLSVRTPADHQGALERLELSPTGPLFGPKMRSPTGTPARIEAEALEACGLGPELPWSRMRELRLLGARRPLRAPLGDPTLTAGEEALVLGVTLPPGSYVTVLVDELFPAGVEEGPAP